MSELANLLNNLRSRLRSEDVPFVIGGAFALAAHGHPRFTRDLDVMVLVDGLAPVHRALAGDRYTMVNEVTFQDAVSGLEIDLFPVEDEAQREAFHDSRRVDLHGATDVRVLSPDGLALMLLREATEGDLERRSDRLRDLETLERVAGLDVEELAGAASKFGYETAFEDAGLGSPERG